VADTYTMASATQDPTQRKGPDNPSSDYASIKDELDIVNAILGGAPAMRAAGKKYLPQYSDETAADYKVRLSKAPFTNIYGDILRNLASKPFSKPVQLDQGTPQNIVDLIEDVDGRGNSLHVFAADVFQDGIAKGVDWIFVDYPQVPATATLADERAIGARPYWVHIPAERVVAVYSDFVEGEEIINHMRIYEPHLERVGFGEVLTERVRILDRAKIETVSEAGQPVVSYAPATSTVWELQQDIERISPPKWVVIEGPLAITVGVIPIVPFITGDRCGSGWAIRSPIADLAELQAHEYRLESSLDHVLDMTAFPMLAGNGVAPPTNEQGAPIVVPVGPCAVLFAPPSSDGKHGEWKWIEPASHSITACAAHLDTTRKEMRELGLQPLLPKTGNLTATASALAAAKAHSAVQAWALTLEEALEEALELSALWLGQDVEITVHVHTDFGSGTEMPTELSAITDMRRDNDLSQDTLWTEMKRRGILSDDFDAETERVLIAANPANPVEAESPVMIQRTQ
jgi:hypothetical protein